MFWEWWLLPTDMRMCWFWFSVSALVNLGSSRQLVSTWSSDKPSVIHLFSTKQQTDTVWDYLVNIVEHLAVKETDNSEAKQKQKGEGIWNHIHHQLKVHFKGLFWAFNHMGNWTTTSLIEMIWDGLHLFFLMWTDTAELTSTTYLKKQVDLYLWQRELDRILSAVQSHSVHLNWLLWINDTKRVRTESVLVWGDPEDNKLWMFVCS